MATHLSFFLLIVLLWIATLAGAQGSATSQSTTVAQPSETGELLRKHRESPSLAVRDPRNFFRGSRAIDKSILWRVHLALQLVKHPELDQRQVQIILDAISLSTPEFFAASTAKKTKADDALQSLTRLALTASPDNQAAELFANITRGKGEADILKMYYDVSALPLKERKAAFRDASSNDKSNLWRTHLTLFLVKRPELNERQKQILLAAMSLGTAEHFRIRSNHSAWKAKVQVPLRSLEEQIVAAFSLEDAAKIFATLGDDTEPPNRSATYETSVLLKSINYKPLSDTGPYKRWTRGRFGGQDLELERNACQCSTESDWCPISKTCQGSNCSSTKSGCGTLWAYPCNGASCQ